MAERTYMGAVSRAADGYSIVFLDLPGCASCGDTLDQALAMGKEALEGHIAVGLDHGDTIPPPTRHTLGDVAQWLFGTDGDPGDDATWVGLFPIEVVIPAPVETVPIRVNANLVHRIAELSQATAHQIDSRHFIEEAVEREIERYRKSAA